MGQFCIVNIGNYDNYLEAMTWPCYIQNRVITSSVIKGIKGLPCSGREYCFQKTPLKIFCKRLKMTNNISFKNDFLIKWNRNYSLENTTGQH